MRRKRLFKVSQVHHPSSVVKITAVDQPTATATAAGRPGAQQVQKETTLQLKYVTGKISSDYVTINGAMSLKSIFG